MPRDTIVPIEGMSESSWALCRRLLVRAGYNEATPPNADGGQYQLEFRDLLRTLGYIGARKVDEYGDFRLQDIRSFERETWGAYWDIQRKFGRLEQQLTLAGAEPLGTHATVTDLMETLADQAVYCVRMIQILRRLEEKGMVPK